MAADEDEHAKVLAKVLGDAPSKKLACQAPADVWAAVTQILHLLSQDLLSSIKNLKDAYELAHELEYSEVNAVFEFLSVDAIPGRVEREFIRTHITAHQKRLTDFLQNYIGKDWSEVTPQ